MDKFQLLLSLPLPAKWQVSTTSNFEGCLSLALLALSALVLNTQPQLLLLPPAKWQDSTTTNGVV
jgi:hypothetical protein